MDGSPWALSRDGPSVWMSPGYGWAHIDSWDGYILDRDGPSVWMGAGHRRALRIDGSRDPWNRWALRRDGPSEWMGLYGPSC